MVGPTKVYRFRFDNGAAWCSIEWIPRKLGQGFLQVMTVLCNCVNFKCSWVLVQCSIHCPTRKSKCTCHLSHLHNRNNVLLYTSLIVSIPREMSLFMPRGAKRLSWRFLCLVKHRDLNVLGCLAAVAAKHWRSTVAVLANKNLVVQCNVIISMLICVNIVSRCLTGYLGCTPHTQQMFWRFHTFSAFGILWVFCILLSHSLAWSTI